MTERLVVARDSPPLFDITLDGNGEMCTVRFYTDVRLEHEHDRHRRYVSVPVDIRIRYYDGLESAVENRYHDWLRFALESNQEGNVAVHEAASRFAEAKRKGVPKR